MDKNHALEVLIDITNTNLGFSPSSPSEFNELCLSIKSKTGRSISLSSVKRLWGYVHYEGFPSATTLNILAQYNGFKDWDTYQSGNIDEESGFLEESVIYATMINPGERLALAWNSNKSCEIECIAPLRFRVNESQNIKLEPGDTFTIHTIILGLPLYISDIERGDTIIPAYIGAKKGGITTITRLPPTPAGCGIEL